MGTDNDNSGVGRLQEWLSPVFSLCPELPESTETAPIAIQSKPVFPITTVFPATSSEPVYVTVHGPDRYCFYRAEMPSALPHPLFTGTPRYGAPSRIHDALPRHLPVGVFIDAQGIGYAESRDHVWRVVGTGQVIKTHFQALFDVAAQAFQQYASRDRTTVLHHSIENSINTKTPENLPPIPLPTAHRLWGEFLDWAFTESTGASNLPPLLAGNTAVYDPALRSAEAIYDASHDTLIVGSSTLYRIDRAEYEISHSIGRHELTHQQLDDHTLHSPLGDIIHAGIALLSTLVCPGWSGCAGEDFLRHEQQRVLRGLLRQNALAPAPIDVPAEAIAYTVQLAEAELFPTAERETIETLYMPLREKVLSLMHTGHIPASVFRLSREYFYEGLKTMLTQFNFDGDVARFAAAYDEHLACAEGDRAACARVGQ